MTEWFVLPNDSMLSEVPMIRIRSNQQADDLWYTWVQSDRLSFPGEADPESGDQGGSMGTLCVEA